MSALPKPEIAASADEWMPVAAAARALGVSRGTIYNRVVQERLEARRIEMGGIAVTLISVASVEREKAAQAA